nr:PadR family transcriptional regulator [uncultured Bacillus sp.]
MSLSLFILGNLAEERCHPYKLKKQLLEVLAFNKMSEGKFYHNFEVLQRKGLIEPVETVQEDHRPNKTLYGITSAGRKYLEEEIYNSFKKISKIEELYISLFLLKYIDPAKAAFFLEDTIRQEEKNLDERERKHQEAIAKRIESLDAGQRKSVEFIRELKSIQSKQNIQLMKKVLTFLMQLNE